MQTIAIIAALLLTAALLFYDTKRHADMSHNGVAFSHSALFLELLGAALSYLWSWTVFHDYLLSVLFLAAWVAMMRARALLIAAATRWFTGDGVPRNHKAGVLAGAMAVGLYLVLAVAGIFHAWDQAGAQADDAALRSRPAQALQSEIDTLRERKLALAGFADPNKAMAEEQAIASAAQSAANRVEQLQAELDAARTAAAPYANPDCSPKKDGRGQPYTSRAAEACARISAAEVALSRAESGSSKTTQAGGYGSRHSEYASVSLALVDAEKRLAQMSATGGGEQQAWGMAYQNLARWTDTTPSQAASMFLMALLLALDAVGFALRWYSAYLLSGTREIAALKDRFARLIDVGVPADQAALMAASGTRVLPASTAVQGEGEPSYRDGGPIFHTGRAFVHGSKEKPEFVLCPESVAGHGGVGAVRAYQDEGKRKYAGTGTPVQEPGTPVQAHSTPVQECSTRVPKRRLRTRLTNPRGRPDTGRFPPNDKRYVALKAYVKKLNGDEEVTASLLRRVAPGLTGFQLNPNKAKEFLAWMREDGII